MVNYWNRNPFFSLYQQGQVAGQVVGEVGVRCQRLVFQPPVFSAETVYTAVSAYLVNPCPEVVWYRGTTQHFVERVLHHVFRFFPVGQITQTEPRQSLPVHLVQHLAGVRFAVAQPDNQRGRHV